MARTRVFVADHGFVKVSEGINIWQTGVVLEDHPAAVRYTDQLREAGTVDAEGARQIRLYGQTATLKSVGHLIRPPGDESSIDTVAEFKKPTDEQRRYDAAREQLLSAGKPASDTAVADELDISPRTVRSWRQKGRIS